MIWMWVQARMEDSSILVQSQVITSLVTNGTDPEVRGRLSRMMYQIEYGLRHQPTTEDPWTLKGVTMNTLRSSEDVQEIKDNRHLSRDDLDQQVEKVRSTLQHHVMTAKAHAGRGWHLQVPYSRILWDVTHGVNLTTAIQNMSAHETWLDRLDIALQSPVRCRWPTGTP